ncbi:MAG: 2-oxoacid:acceptor oxidoreductase family protein, partial [Candidatus Thermoplasmatota archaeon]|nr:2-oxoacid:acceptor oxidoreductase family protein [Candidatus Thermoplasmatota archaeon]
MERVFTFLVGGKAGEGVKKAGNSIANMMAMRGLRVFQYDDYQNLIKGGHNFSAVSASAGEISSHYLEYNIAVLLDERSVEAHKGHIAKGGALVYDSDSVKDSQGIGIPISSEARKYPSSDLRKGLAGVAVAAAYSDLGKHEFLEFVRREYSHDAENNIAFAGAIYDLAYSELGGKIKILGGGAALPVISGNEAIALGLAAGGLDMYFSYPMTPTTSLLHYLAAHAGELGVTVAQPENEIAVAQMVLGSTFAGARAAAGSSGGGFALMQETFSLAGMAEAPALFILSSRPGPSTGMPT